MKALRENVRKQKNHYLTVKGVKMLESVRLRPESDA